MEHDLFILVIVLMGFAVVWPLRAVRHAYVSPQTTHLIGRVALLALYGHATVLLAATLVDQTGAEALRTQIQDLQARTTATAQKVKASKAAINALGPKPAPAQTDALRVWQDVRSVLDHEAQVNWASVDRLVKDLAALKQEQRTRSRAHETRTGVILASLGALLASVFMLGVYRNYKRIQPGT
jgi:hypothetical protein